jgi:hypothetical protein
MVARSGVPRGTTVPGLPTVVLLHGTHLQSLVVEKQRDGAHTVRVFEDGTPAVPAGCVTLCIPHMAGIQRSLRLGDSLWLWKACRGLREGLRAAVRALIRREPTAAEWAEMEAVFPPLRIDAEAKAREVAALAQRQFMGLVELLRRLTSMGRGGEAVEAALPREAAERAREWFPEARTISELHSAVSQVGGFASAAARETAVLTKVDGAPALPAEMVPWIGMGIQGMTAGIGDDELLSLEEAVHAAAERSTRVGAGAKRAMDALVDEHVPDAPKEERGKLGIGLQLAKKKKLPLTREVALRQYWEHTTKGLGAAHGELRRLEEAVDPVALRAATFRLQAESAATSVVRPAAKGVARAEQEGWKRLRIAQQAEGEERDTLKLAVALARQAKGGIMNRGKLRKGKGGVRQISATRFEARLRMFGSVVSFPSHRSEAEAQRTMDVLYIVRGDAPQYFSADQYPVEALAPPLPEYATGKDLGNKATLKESLGKLVELVASWHAKTSTVEDVAAARRALGQLVACILQDLDPGGVWPAAV